MRIYLDGWNKTEISAYSNLSVYLSILLYLSSSLCSSFHMSITSSVSPTFHLSIWSHNCISTEFFFLLNLCLLRLIHLDLFMSVLIDLVVTHTRTHTHVCVCCVCVCVLINPFIRGGSDKRSVFQALFDGFEIKLFLLLDQLPHQS